jgi:hypothetical protein
MTAPHRPSDSHPVATSNRSTAPIETVMADWRQKPLVRRAAIGTVAAAAGAVAFLSHSRQALASAFTLTSADGTATYEIDNTGSGVGVWGRSETLSSSPTSPFRNYSGVAGTAGAGGQGVFGLCNGGPGSWGR